MTLMAFAVLDVKADAFSPPFFMAARGMASRAFEDLVRDPQSSLFKHPDDFRLYEVGAFEVESGVMTGLGTPKFVVSGSDVKGGES